MRDRSRALYLHCFIIDSLSLSIYMYRYYAELQISPGRYDERVFKALDHVISEAGQHGIRLLLSLVNNLQAYGSKTQYVQWPWEEGVGLSSSNDSFFYDPSIRHYFKNHVNRASQDDLKKAYRKAAIKNHPDKGGDPEKHDNFLDYLYSALF
ncbi:mannan endo-1,4-beta-mannosidase 2-like isoform X3 [Actinidia eriantha]|uniref:mannan endo-1,4-beta-mannosidase 2-like isoform X3 n=1 Tax=Actinidia eriantha TaxID=165200 RepID=UPI00258FF813|nr:mannan endo-1,4-beta-mannosidase 2-like isoform X3 [Actinidia eriantha]